tara:strand:+ start:4073 stop:4294 length:222 start_codon:yes stop_codon:yes gene_type:complete
MLNKEILQTVYANWSRDLVINWLVENDVKYGMQRRLRRYVNVSRKELINEIIARQELEETSGDIYKPNKPSLI